MGMLRPTAGEIIVEHIFSDKTKMVLVWDEREKWVVDHKEKYLSLRVKYLGADNSDYQYSYGDFYKKALELTYKLYKSGKCTGDMARDEIMRYIFLAHEIERVDTSDIESVRRWSEATKGLMIKWDKTEFGFNEDMEKTVVGAGLGFIAEDRYLKYETRIKFGRDINLIKYYLVLVGDVEVVLEIERLIGKKISIGKGRLSPNAAAQLFNKDGIGVDVKEKFVIALMTNIRKKFDPTYEDIESAWE